MTIERAAKAMADAWERGLTTDGLNLARAALEAIAEPTPEMIEAALGDHRGTWRYISKKYINTIWRAMHAAMMKEGK